jgi:hypothetical protein
MALDREEALARAATRVGAVEDGVMLMLKIRSAF